VVARSNSFSLYATDFINHLPQWVTALPLQYTFHIQSNSNASTSTLLYYVLFSEKDTMLYVDYSPNLANRILNHNSGGTKSTAYRRPLKLIFCEFYLFEKDARNREKYFKTTVEKKAIKLMLKSTLYTLGYAEKVSFIFVEENEV
jgi:putative endonuclease